MFIQNQKINTREQLNELLNGIDMLILTEASVHLNEAAHRNIKTKNISTESKYIKQLNKELAFLLFRNYDYFVINNTEIFGYKDLVGTLLFTIRD